MKITAKATLAALAAIGLALTGSACSGGSEKAGDTTQEPAAELATAEFRVEGMTCGGCAIATEMAVEKLDGVESADAEYLGGEKSGRCRVTYDPSLVSTAQIASAIEGAGFDPALASTSSGS